MTDINDLSKYSNYEIKVAIFWLMEHISLPLDLHSKIIFKALKMYFESIKQEVKNISNNEKICLHCDRWHDNKCYLYNFKKLSNGFCDEWKGEK